MTLQLFPLLQDHTRLIRFKDTLYKVKVKFKLDTFPSEDLHISQLDAHNQIEEVFRAVLYMNERNQALKTIATPNFLIRTLKIPWSFPSKCSDHVFQQNGKTLKVFDHLFEFRVSNKGNDSKSKGADKIIANDEKDLDDSHSYHQAEKLVCKPALVIVSDLNSGAPARFGRTKDGQLYKVCAGNTKSDLIATNSDADDGARMSNMGGLRSPRDVTENLKLSENTKQRNKKVVQETDRNNMQLISRDSALEKISKKYNEKTINNISKKGSEENSEVVKRKSSRNKHSVRESELKALGYTSIQGCRLRFRKSSNETTLSHNLRKQAHVVKYNEIEGTESSQTETEGSKTEPEGSQTETNSSKTEAEGSQTETEGSESQAENSGSQNRSNMHKTKMRTRHGMRKKLKLSKSKRKQKELNLRKSAVSDKKRQFELSESDSNIGDRINTRRKLRSSMQHNDSSSIITSSDSESRQSPRKTIGLSKKRKIENLSDDETQSASQESGRSKKVKLYGVRHSPQIITDTGVKGTARINSPKVSTVLPLKRSRTSPASQTSQGTLPPVASPRLTRQSVTDTEARRIADLRDERPSQIYRDMMLSQRRDRHLVQQAENAEIDKLRQFYEPTVPRRSPRLNQEAKKRRSSGLWGKIMEALVTPTKRYMFGNKK